MNELERFEPLLALLENLPAIELPAGRKSIGRGLCEDSRWWVKFSLDTKHALAWRVVQELGYILNYVSLDDRLPTVFKPVSPPPYLNGGVEFLSWVIECQDPDISPAACAEWLQARLPSPLTDVRAWELAGDGC